MRVIAPMLIKYTAICQTCKIGLCFTGFLHGVCNSHSEFCKMMVCHCQRGVAQQRSQAIPLEKTEIATPGINPRARDDTLIQQGQWRESQPGILWGDDGRQ